VDFANDWTPTRSPRKPLHYNTLSSSLFAPAGLTPAFGEQRPSSGPGERLSRSALKSIDQPPAGGHPDGDDDLLEIRFGLADPAISKLKAG